MAIYHEDAQLTIYSGDALAVMQTMADESVQCCVTSPPYYGLRDYGVDGQIGLEATPEAYIANLVDVFREVRRVLKDDGTLWVNIGDSYASSTKGSGGSGKASGLNCKRNDDGTFHAESHASGASAVFDVRRFDLATSGLKPKDLIGIPWMLAFALRADGWYLRSEIIWHKLNPMPESVTDRPTKAHEQIFLLSKSPKYFYDSDAVKEPCSPANVADFKNRKTMDNKSNGRGSYEDARPDLCRSREAYMPSDFLRNRRSVWSIASAPYSDAHFATFPPALIEPCIMAGSRIGDTVLDPFGGSGTTAEVANKFGRKAVLIELNPEYCELAMKRNCQKTLFAGAEV